MEQGLNLSVVALLAILVIGFYVFVIRKKPEKTSNVGDPGNGASERIGPPPTSNAAPEALEPFIVGNGEWNEKLTIDVRHRQHGCDSSGAPTSETGVYDPDHELLEYWFEVEGPNQNGDTIPYAVYNRRGERIDRRWLPTDTFEVYYRDRRDPSSPTEQNAVVYCFVGHNKDEPPFPMVANMDCNRRPGGESRLPPDLGKPLGVMKILYKARDPKGQVDGNGVGVRVYSGGCG